MNDELPIVDTLGQVNISVLTVIQGTIALGLLLWITSVIAQLAESRIKASPNLTPSQITMGASIRFWINDPMNGRVNVISSLRRPSNFSQQRRRYSCSTGPAAKYRRIR